MNYKPDIVVEVLARAHSQLQGGELSLATFGAFVAGVLDEFGERSARRRRELPDRRIFTLMASCDPRVNVCNAHELSVRVAHELNALAEVPPRARICVRQGRHIVLRPEDLGRILRAAMGGRVSIGRATLNADEPELGQAEVQKLAKTLDAKDA